MVEKPAFLMLLRASRGDAAVLLSTFLLTVFRDLTEAIVVGFALGSVLFIHRMSKATAIESAMPLVSEDKADDQNGGRMPYDSGAADPNIMVYRITGAFFFGAASSIGSVLDRIADTHKALVIDLAAVPLLDATAANTIEVLAAKAKRRGVRIVLTGTSHELRRDLFAHGIKPPVVTYERTIEEGIAKMRRVLAEAA